ILNVKLPLFPSTVHGSQMVKAVSPECAHSNCPGRTGSDFVNWRQYGFAKLVAHVPGSKLVPLMVPYRSTWRPAWPFTVTDLNVPGAGTKPFVKSPGSTGTNTTPPLPVVGALAHAMPVLAMAVARSIAMPASMA